MVVGFVCIKIKNFLNRYTPFISKTELKIYEKIIKVDLTYPKYLSKECTSLISGFLKLSPALRLGVLEGGIDRIKRHPFFKGFSWENLESRKMVAPIQPKLKSEIDTSNFFNVKERQDDEIFDYESYIRSSHAILLEEF